MNIFAPFSLEYHNRDGGTSAAPIRRVPYTDDGALIRRGDPFGIGADGFLQAYVPSQGVFGVALFDVPGDLVDDEGHGNYLLSHPVSGENIAYRVQAKHLDESDEPNPINAAGVLGETFDMDGTAGAMWLDVSDSTGTDFLVIDIESTVSDWGDNYPILIVKPVNPQTSIT